MERLGEGCSLVGTVPAKHERSPGIDKSPALPKPRVVANIFLKKKLEDENKRIRYLSSSGFVVSLRPALAR